MKNNKLQIDVGRGILTIESCAGRDSAIVNAYINGISLRCGSLNLDRVRNTFVDTIISACLIDEDDPRVTISLIEDEIEAFIDSALQ